MLDLSFQYPAWFLIFCALLGLGYAMLLYYRDTTFRERAPRLNRLLGVLRWLSVTIIAALLLAPLLKSLLVETKKPVVVLAQDQSESAGLDLQGQALETYRTNWQALRDQLGDQYEIHELAFGDEVREGVNFQFTDKVTNLSQLVRSVYDLYSGQNLGAVVLASDGVYNEGSNPAYTDVKLNAPVYTIALGDTTPKKDLVLKRVFHNKIVYLGDQFTLQVDVAATNAGGAQTALSAKEANLQALINNTSHAILAFDKEYNITVINRTLRKLYLGNNIILKPGQNLLKDIENNKQEKIDLENKLKENAAELIQLQKDVEQNKQSQLDLVVDFTANGEGKCFFEFSYMTGGAGWEPSYDFRLNEQTKALTIIMKAVVKQESGKDWNRVLLILSDRVPSSNTQVPTLSTWNLDVNTPIRPLHKSKSLSRASRESVAYEGAPMLSEASDMASMEYTSSMTQRSYSTLSVEYQIADRLTIKGNGQEEIVSVIQYNLPITKKYLAIPKVQEEAFLLANITDWDTLNLLPGKASVYLDGSYTSDIRIDPSILSDTFPLLVGSDPGIVVNRSLVTAQTTVRTVGAQKRVMKTYSLGIRNKKKTPIEVIVKDQVPVSANSQISVDILELSGGTFNKETGEVEWKVLVPPMAQIEKRISFEIKFPKNQLVEGL